MQPKQPAQDAKATANRTANDCAWDVSSPGQLHTGCLAAGLCRCTLFHKRLLFLGGMQKEKPPAACLVCCGADCRKLGKIQGRHGWPPRWLHLDSDKARPAGTASKQHPQTFGKPPQAANETQCEHANNKISRGLEHESSSIQTHRDGHTSTNLLTVRLSTPLPICLLSSLLPHRWHHQLCSRECLRQASRR